MKNNSEQVNSKPITNINEECSLRTIDELRRENARLKKKLNEAEIAAEVYSKMIDIAEKRFNISIREKSGAKQ